MRGRLMKVKIKYEVIKEKEFEVDEDTFDNNNKIDTFWSQLKEQEMDCIKVKGIRLKKL